MVDLEKMKQIFNENYSFKATTILPFTRNIFKVQTEKDFKKLMRARIKPDKLFFAHTITDSLKKSNQTSVANIYLTKEGWPYFLLDHNFWILMDWCNGKEINLHNLREVELTTKTLARIHKSLKHIVPQNPAKTKNHWEKWPIKIMEGHNLLDYLNNYLNNQKNISPFYEILMSNNSLLNEAMKKAVELAHSPSCQEMIKREKEERTVSYGRMKEDSILMGFDGQIYFVNPLKMEYDVRIKDLGLWIQRLIKKAKYKSHELLQVVEWYNSIRPLSRGEKNWLLSFLAYPGKIIKLTTAYSYSKKPWTEEGYVRKLKKFLSKKEKEIAIYDRLSVRFKELGDG